MSTVEIVALRKLHDKLRVAVKDLIDEIPITQYMDNGDIVLRFGPSLLEQLQVCISNNSGGSGRGKNSWNRFLISIAAFDLYRKLEKDWCVRGKSLESSLRSMPSVMATCTDLNKMRALVHTIELISRSISLMLDPPRRYHVAAACPACNVRMIKQWDSVNREEVQVPALTVDGFTGCTCLACGYVWPPDRLEHLALVLGCAPIL